ncbi:MAG: transposase [Anaerovoracaceae bacterium]
MRASRVSPEEQYRLIMECRRSGLSDQQWCLNNDIKPGTFYNWVKRLRQKGHPDEYYGVKVQSFRENSAPLSA